MDNVWTNLGNRLETAWKRPTRPNSKRPKDGEIIDEEKSVRWKNSMMPLISTPAPVTKQKVKNFLTAELAVITKRILKTCTSTAAKRCRRGVAL